MNAWFFLAAPILILLISLLLLQLVAQKSRSFLNKPETLVVRLPHKALDVLESRKIKGRTLLYLGSSLPANVSLIKPGIDAQSNIDELRKRLDRTIIPPNDTHYLYLATLKGLVRTIIWVLPEQEGKVTVKQAFFTNLFRRGPSLEGVLLGATPLTACSIENIPRLDEPLLVIVDADSVGADSLARFTKTWRQMKLSSDLIMVTTIEEDMRPARRWAKTLRELEEK